MVNHKLLRLSATLSFVGLLVYSVASLLHAGGGATYEATFASYAASADWVGVHLGQFIGMAGLLAGLLGLFFALNISQGAPRWVGFFAAISAGVTLALEGVLYAVDGVALKQAVNAWASAPAAEQATRFASAQAIRWLEWGTNSYSNLMLGLTMVLLAIVIVWTARVPRPIGYLMGLSGLSFIVLGWFVGAEGFTPIHNVPMNAGALFLSAWILWLLIVAWRRKESVQAAIG
jgi:hypothetical protein